MVVWRTVVLLIVLVIIVTLVLLYEYYGNNISIWGTDIQSTSSAICTSSEICFTPSEMSGVDFFRSFFSNMTMFYAKYRGTGYVSVTSGFCQALLLGHVVNSTYMLINDTLYRYGVLAYKPMGRGYVVFKELDLGSGVRVTHIPPQRNITVTGGFGHAIWFNISVNGEERVYWNTENPGVVYEKEKLICTHDTVRVDSTTIHIVRLFFVKHGVESGVGVASIWLALLPVGDY